MKLSTRGWYALRAAIDLTANGREQPVLRRALAGRLGISPEYVAQILRVLRDVGMVKSVRGPGGGYQLSGNLSHITAGDVVRAVEGSSAVVYCANEPIHPPCPRSGSCAARGLWIRLSSQIDRCLNEVSLAELAAEDGKQALG